MQGWPLRYKYTTFHCHRFCSLQKHRAPAFHVTPSLLIFHLNKSKPQIWKITGSVTRGICNKLIPHLLGQNIKSLNAEP